MSTEMVRPYVRKVGGTAFGGFNYEKLRIAAVARCIQCRLAVHSCTTRYCLEGRTFAIPYTGEYIGRRLAVFLIPRTPPPPFNIRPN